LTLPIVLLCLLLNKPALPVNASIKMKPTNETAIAITAHRAYLSLIFWITDMIGGVLFKKWMAKIGQFSL
jgi:hypothetical protein